MENDLDLDLDLEKARLLSLASDFGFDEETSRQCLDRLIRLYGIHFTHCMIKP